MKRLLIAIITAIMLYMNVEPAFAQASAPIAISQAVQHDEDQTEFSNIHLNTWEKVLLSLIATIVCIYLWEKEQEDD
jgi:hypothetical protein